MLAETVSFDGGELAVLLIIALLALLALIAVVVLGFVLAPKAARGSTGAFTGWVVVLVIEGLFCMWSVAALIQTELSVTVLFFPIAVAAQVALFLWARRER